MTAPCAIEYILVTRWRGGKKRGQNGVCACDTRGGSWQKHVVTLKVLGRGWRFHDFFGAQTGTRKEGFLHVALTTLFNKSLPWHALGPCIHSLNRNRTDVTGKSVRVF